MKPKILFLVAPQSSAVRYYRLLLPFNNLKGSNEVDVYATTTDYIPSNMPFDIVHFNARLLS